MRWKRRRTRDDDLDREIRSHLELEAEEQQGNGLSLEEARYAAKRALGNTTLVKEEVRQMWKGNTVERFWQDLHYAVRSILRRPVFAITATLTIALAIGANTTVYAVIDAVLLEPLPFRQPDRLVQVRETYPGLHRLPVSVPDYLDWEKSSKTLDLAAYTFQAMDKATLLGRGNPMAVQATNATASLFGVLGIKPLLGRVYSTEEVKNKAPVALISERLWRRKFSASRDVIGRPLQLGKSSFTIAGVIPQKIFFLCGQMSGCRFR